MSAAAFSAGCGSPAAYRTYYRSSRQRWRGAIAYR